MMITAEMMHERPGHDAFRVSHAEAEALCDAAQTGQHAYANRALGILLYTAGWSAQEVAAATGQRVQVVSDVMKAWPVVRLAVLGARG